VTTGGGFIYASGSTLYSTDGSSFPTASGSVSLDTDSKAAVVYEGSGDYRVNLNNSWGTAAAYDGSFTNSLGEIRVCSRPGGGAALSCTLIRNIRRYDLDYVEAQAKIDELMS
jgi:hypothetical protein